MEYECFFPCSRYRFLVHAFHFETSCSICVLLGSSNIPSMKATPHSAWISAITGVNGECICPGKNTDLSPVSAMSGDTRHLYNLHGLVRDPTLCICGGFLSIGKAASTSASARESRVAHLSPKSSFEGRLYVDRIFSVKGPRLWVHPVHIITKSVS